MSLIHRCAAPIAGVVVLILAAPAPAQVLISDDFTSFNTSTWTTAPYLTGGYQGLPQTLSPITLDGNSVLRTISIMSPNQRRGFGSVNSFTASAGTLGVDFKTLPFNDPSVPAANQFNIDGLLELQLFNPTNGRHLFMSVFGSSTGSNRVLFFDTNVPGGGGVSQNGGAWQYDTYYRFVVDSDGSTTRMSLRTPTNTELFGRTFNFGLDALGSYRVVLSQGMGIPNGEYYSGAAVDRLVFTAVPEPGSLALCGLAAAGCIGYARRKSKQLRCR